MRLMILGELKMKINDFIKRIFLYGQYKDFQLVPIHHMRKSYALNEYGDCDSNDCYTKKDCD